MRTPYIIVSLAALASAQYAITDVIGDKGAQKTHTSDSSASPFGGHAEADTNVDPMSQILAKDTSHPNLNGGHLPTSLSGAALGSDAMKVVSGLVEAFLHKVALHSGEKSCIENNIAQVAADVMGTVGDIVTTSKALIDGKGTVPSKSTGNVVGAGMDSLMKITSLVTLSMNLMKSCFHGDALDMLKLSAKHMINGTYLEHQLLVNGVDIAHFLADGVTAFESHDFHRFGKDIGTALRKVLLSKNTKAVRLPEGMPDKVIIQKATDGLMQGFFERGSMMVITDKAKPDVDIVINLHRCMAGNSEFFKELWMSAWDLVAQLSLNGVQHGLFYSNAKDGNFQPKWQGELMQAMMQFPMALQKCGLSTEMQDMLNDAIQSLNAVKVQLKIPMASGTPNTADIMAKAVEDWTNWDFEKFGYQMGKMLREMLVLVFPQKYSIDASGRLQKYSQVKSGVASTSVTIVGGVVAASLIAFAVVRARRSMPSTPVEAEPLTCDLEDGDNHVIE